jgi:hypothetical protein
MSLGQEAAVLADRIAAHRALARARSFQEGDHLVCCGSGGLVDRRGLDAVDQPALAVRALVPGVHGVEHGIALVHREHRALDAKAEVGAR